MANKNGLKDIGSKKLTEVTKLRLYDLTVNHLKIQAAIENGDSEELDVLLNTKEAIEEAIEVKAEGYAKIIRSIEGQALAIKAEEERLAKRRKSLESNAKHLKQSLEQSMIDVGMKKLKTQLFSFNIQKNPPSVEVLNDAAVPETYLILQDPKLDKKAILADLKNGVAVPGVEIKQSEGLRIR
jgi:Siphovirus Gp157